MINYSDLIIEEYYLPTDLYSITSPSIIDTALLAISRLEELTGERFVYAKMYSKFCGWLRCEPVPITKGNSLDVFIKEKYDKDKLMQIKAEIERDLSSGI